MAMKYDMKKKATLRWLFDVLFGVPAFTLRASTATAFRL